MPTQQDLDRDLAAARAAAENAAAAADQALLQLAQLQQVLSSAAGVVASSVAHAKTQIGIAADAAARVAAMNPKVSTVVVPPPPPPGPRPYKATDLDHDDPRDGFGVKVNTGDHAIRIGHLEDAFGVPARWLMCFDGVDPFDATPAATKLERAAEIRPDSRYVIACRSMSVDTEKMIGGKLTRTPNRGPKTPASVAADAVRTSTAVQKDEAKIRRGVGVILGSAPADQTEIRGPGHEHLSDWYVFGYGLVMDASDPVRWTVQQLLEGRGLMAGASRKMWEDWLEVWADEAGALYDKLVFRYNLAGTLGVGDDDEMWVQLVLDALPKRFPAGRITRIRISTDDYVAELGDAVRFARNLKRSRMIRSRYAAMGLEGLVVVESIGIDEIGGHNLSTDTADDIRALEREYRGFGGLLVDEVRSGNVAGGVMFFESTQLDRKLSTQMLAVDTKLAIAGRREVVGATGKRHVSNYPVLFETLRDGIKAFG